MSEGREVGIFVRAYDFMSGNMAKMAQSAAGFASKVTEPFDRFGRVVEAARSKLIGFAAAFAIVGQLKRLADDIANLSEKAQGLGTSAEVLSRLQFGFEQLGASGEQAGRAIGRLQQVIGDVNRGQSKEAAEAFERLGLQIRDLARLDTGTAFLKVAEAIGRVATTSERASIANDLFGRGLSQELLPIIAQGAGELDRFGRAADRLNITVGSDSARRWDDFADSVEKLWLVGKRFLQGVLEPIIQPLGGVLSIVGELVGVVSKLTGSLTGLVSIAFDKIAEGLNDVAKGAEFVVRSILGTDKGGLADAVEGLNKLLGLLPSGQRQGQPFQVTLPQAPDDLDEQLKRFMAGRKQAIQELGEEEQARAASEVAAQRMMEMAAEARGAEAVAALRAEEAAAQEAAGAYREIVALQREQADLAAEAADRANNFAGGISRGFLQFAEDWGQLRDIGEEFAYGTMATFSRSAADAFTQFATSAQSAKDAFADFGRNFIATLIRMTTQMVISLTIARALFGIFGVSTGGIGAGEGALAGAGAGNRLGGGGGIGAGGGLANSIGGAGGILRSTGGAGGGGTVIVQVQTIDGPSTEQFFRRNRGILAASMLDLHGRVTTVRDRFGG